MTYSIIGISAAVIIIINNRDVLWKKYDYSNVTAYNVYRQLLYGILAYYITDILWGILPDAATIPIIALTANAFDEDIKKSQAAGMNEHLSKPVEPELIFKTLRKYI